MGVLFWLAAMLLAAGLWTSIIAGIFVVGDLVTLAWLPFTSCFVAFLGVLPNMSALVLLGGGAYSLDGLLYGRRRIEFKK
jgi:hypothetical protein